MRFNSVSFRVMLCVATLGFSTSCGVTDPSNSGGGSWVPNLPYNVKAYVLRQSCSSGQVVRSDLVVDFGEVELASPVTRDNMDGYPSIYCNDESTTCRNFTIDDNARAAQTSYNNDKLPSITFANLTNRNYSLTLITEAYYTDDQSNRQQAPLVGGDITINFPNNTTCGYDIGNIECNMKNDCLDAPESHICTFNYEDCTNSAYVVLCNEGYVQTNDGTGVLFEVGNKTALQSVECARDTSS